MKKFPRLFASGLAVSLFCLALAGCAATRCEDRNDNASFSDSAQAPASEAGGTLVREIGAEPATLNPVTATDAYEGVVNGGIYETLSRRNSRTLEFEPLLARSWEVSEDRLSYTFHLRKDVKWHDGTPFTADDVVFSYNAVKDPKVAAAHLQSYYKDVRSYTKIDSHTVRCEYSKPYFLAFEFCSGIPVVARHVFEKGDFNRNPAGRRPVGTGPYVFESWETGREITVRKNPDYWGEPPSLDRIVYSVILDPTVKLQLMRKQELDFASLLPLQWSRQTCDASFAKKFRRATYTVPAYSYIGWNSERPYFSDRRVRRAMTHLVDRETILEKILLGLGETVVTTFFVNSPEYPDDVEPYPYDPEKARALLDEAGWKDTDGDGVRDKDGVKFRFEFLLSSGSQLGEKISTILKEELSRSGVEMTIRRMEWAVFIKNINERRFDAATLGWSLAAETDPYQLWHSSQAEGGSNFVGFRNPRADALIERAREEFSRPERVKMYREFSRILREEQPYTFLFARKATVAVHGRFRNARLYPLGFDPLEWSVPAALRKY